MVTETESVQDESGSNLDTEKVAEKVAQDSTAGSHKRKRSDDDDDDNDDQEQQQQQEEPPPAKKRKRKISPTRIFKSCLETHGITKSQMSYPRYVLKNNFLSLVYISLGI